MTYIDFPFNGKTLQIDQKLAETLASCVYNVQDDWDIVILVTGNRTVRTGKSVMAMTCAAFIAYMLKKLDINQDAFTDKSIFFDGAKMLDEAQKLKYSVIIMDEARESLAASKSTMQLQQSILDFFTECGQLRNIFIVVLPDFYDLKEMIAVPRSEMLVNVYREDRTIHKDFMGDGIKHPITMFTRGYFKLYNRNSKGLMYDIFRTTRRKDYGSVTPSIPPGRFVDQYPIDEAKYRQMKKDALARFKEKHAEKPDKRDIKLLEQAKMLLQIVKEETKMTDEDIGKKLGGSRMLVTNLKKGIFDKKEPTGYVADSD